MICAVGALARLTGGYITADTAYSTRVARAGLDTFRLFLLGWGHDYILYVWGGRVS